MVHPQNSCQNFDNTDIGCLEYWQKYLGVGRSVVRVSIEADLCQAMKNKFAQESNMFVCYTLFRAWAETRLLLCISCTLVLLFRTWAGKPSACWQSSDETVPSWSVWMNLCSAAQPVPPCFKSGLWHYEKCGWSGRLLKISLQYLTSPHKLPSPSPGVPFSLFNMKKCQCGTTVLVVPCPALRAKQLFSLD